jgi:hypothetical protein
MRCTALRRDGHPCHATATWDRWYCPRHDPCVTWRPTGYPQHVRDRALDLYRQGGPIEAERQTGVRAGTIRVWAQRAGITSPHVPYGWARDVRTWPATVAAQDAAERRRQMRRMGELRQIVRLLGG